MNHNKYICIIEDTTDGQDEYTNLDDLRSDLNTDLGMIGLCVIDIKRYNVAPVSAPELKRFGPKVTPKQFFYDTPWMYAEEYGEMWHVDANKAVFQFAKEYAASQLTSKK